ncbi:hypothetical protein [Prevotella corporis]|uniref:hypothetical protein n=1 Tax=Prevotella corporis TaxID=28128 RepID=UPI0012DE1290|nr:hypothetical protein [Prevotella corporis]
MKKQFLHLFVSCLMGTTAVGGLSLIPQNVMAQSTAPSMTIENVSFTRAEGYIGETIEMKKFHIQVANTTVPVILEITGYDKKQFMVTPTTIPAGTSDTEITVTYKPTTVKAHKANLTIDCTELPEKYSMVKLEGIAIDKNNPPMATVTPNTLEQFKCEPHRRQCRQYASKPRTWQRIQTSVSHRTRCSDSAQHQYIRTFRRTSTSPSLRSRQANTRTPSSFRRTE